MKNFLLKFWKYIVGIFLIAGAGAAVVGLPSTPCIDSYQTLNDKIINCSIVGKEKANIKSLAISKLNFAKYTDLATGITVEIKDGKITQIDGGIELYARAWKGTNQLGLGKDGTTEWEHFRIFNPPIMVDDPNGTVIRTWEDSITKEIKTRKLREDPLAAIKSTLAHTIKVSSREGTNIVKGSFGNTTSTFYPDAGDPGTDTVDGTVRRDGTPDVWANVRNGAGTGVQNSTNLQLIYFSSHNVDTQWAQIWRARTSFKTSIIGTDTISSAILSVYGNDKADPSTLGIEVDVYISTPGANNTLATSDYNVANWGSTSQTGTPITYANFNTTAYNDFTFNATGIGNINKTGVSNFGTREVVYDAGNTTPTWTSLVYPQMTGYAADEAGTAKDPKLVVVHSAAAAAPTPVSPVILFD